MSTATPPGHSWRLLVVGENRITRLELTGASVVAVRPDGTAEVVASASSGSPAAAFVARADGVLELNRDSETAVLLNDVQLARSAELRAGDLVQVGEVTVLVQRASPRPAAHPRQRLRDRASFEARLREEVSRAEASGGRLTLVLARGVPPDLPESALVIESRLAPWMSALLVFDGDSVGVEERVRRNDLRDRILGWASVPDDAVDVDELIECALARLQGDGRPPLISVDERVVVDPVMVRLRSLTERVALERADVLLEGEHGTGKRLWAWHLHLRSGLRSESWSELDGRHATAEQLHAVLGARDAPPDRHGSLLIRHVDALSSPLQRELLDRWPAQLRVLGTTAASIGAQRTLLLPELRERLSPVTLSLPALRDRPQEILPLAMQAVQHARARLRRPGLSLNADARAALQAWPWPGNVRELRNEIALAAHLAESDEIRVENLSPALLEHFEESRPDAAGRDLRQSLKLAEKNALLAVLARTNWNVTAAAKELGLPRRTVVYRISRLGLRRPAR